MIMNENDLKYHLDGYRWIATDYEEIDNQFYQISVRH